MKNPGKAAAFQGFLNREAVALGRAASENTQLGSPPRVGYIAHENAESRVHALDPNCARRAAQIFSAGRAPARFAWPFPRAPLRRDCDPSRRDSLRARATADAPVTSTTSALPLPRSDRRAACA